MAQPKLGPVKQQGGERGAHAVGFGRFFYPAGNGPVGFVGGSGQHGPHVVIAGVDVELGDVFHHELGGNFSRGVPAHAVGKYEEMRAGIGRILIIPPHKALVGANSII